MIGILSDSHDNLPALGDAVRLFRAAGCRLLIHAGDVVAPFAARLLQAAGCPVRAVFGNCDGEREGLRRALEPFGLIQEAPFILETDGKKILVVHSHASVAGQAAGNAYDLVVFGHTHRPGTKTAGRTLILNPGEAGGWVTGKRTVALYDPAAHEAEIIPL